MCIGKTRPAIFVIVKKPVYIEEINVTRRGFSPEPV